MWNKRSAENQPGVPSQSSRSAPVALLVDDTSDNRDMYGEMLRYGGYAVLEAADGLDALAVTVAELPNIIVMDICMPRMDGWEAIRRLRADPRTASIPVVALTAVGWNAGAAGMECEAFLVKPCLPIDLLGVLDTLLARAQ